MADSERLAGNAREQHEIDEINRVPKYIMHVKKSVLNLNTGIHVARSLDPFQINSS